MTPSGNILALDLGTKTGWATSAGGVITASGVAEFSVSRWQGGGMRFLRFRSWLDEMGRLTSSISQVWYEEVRRHVGTDAAHVYGGLQATLSMWAEERKLPYSAVPVGTWKKHVTGKGNAPKQAVIDAVRAKGRRPADDNEADAIGILTWVLETDGGAR